MLRPVELRYLLSDLLAKLSRSLHSPKSSPLAKNGGVLNSPFYNLLKHPPEKVLQRGGTLTALSR